MEYNFHTADPTAQFSLVFGRATQRFCTAELAIEISSHHVSTEIAVASLLCPQMYMKKRCDCELFGIQ
jgi:hypothetical protein